MTNNYFISLEDCPQGERKPLSRVPENLSFDTNGLIPVIAPDHHSHEVLMMAWMNREAIELTLDSGSMTYWSRSKSQLWRKGETSGHHQRLKFMRSDCDTLLCSVEQLGAACHTGRQSCFYLELETHTNCAVIIDSASSQHTDQYHE